jgi:hypothetical protein
MSETAIHFDYSSVDYEIRQDMPDAYREVWRKIANPGNWWRGADRVAIAAEVRNARHCELCRQRKAALSPYSVNGGHKTSTNLPQVAVDAVYRITTDASRLTETWLKQCEAEGLNHEKYIELLGVVVAVISIDAFHRAIGLPLEDLPQHVAGEPTGNRPNVDVAMGAWVPTVSIEAAVGSEADLYNGKRQTGNVIAAMSLVPDSVRLMKLLSGVQYLPLSQLTHLESNAGRDISRPQMELLAGRVSSLNDCFY